MNTKTTKPAVTGDTTKPVPAMRKKRSRQAGAASGAGGAHAPRSEPTSRRRRKPFVL